MKEIGVGILGFGTVGAGVAEGLLRNRKLMAERLDVDIVLKRIADLDITTDRGVRVDPDVLTTDAQAVIADPEVRIVVETIGGTGIARTLVLAALNAGKAVVTANKKLLAECGKEIFDTAKKNGVDIADATKKRYTSVRSFDLASIDPYIAFRKLPVGNYRYKVKAEDINGTIALLLSKEFKVVKEGSRK